MTDKPRIAPGEVAAPPVLLPYQRAWVADKSPVALWEKSRRIGASWCDAADSVETAAAAGGQDALYIGYSEDMTREYIDDCAMWARAFQIAAGAMQETVYADERDIKAFRIDFASGHKILALSSRPRSIRGKQGKVTIDEAAFHEDLDGLLKAALAMLIWGGRVRVLSSHNGEDNPFNLLVKDVRAGRAPYALHRTTFGEAVAAGLYDRVMLVQGAIAKSRGVRFEPPSREAWVAAIYAQYGERAGEELDCIPKFGTGAYLPRSIVERAMVDGIPILKLKMPAEAVLDDTRLAQVQAWIDEHLESAIAALPPGRTVLGADFGRSGNLSVNLVLVDLGAGRWRTGLVAELRNVPFDCQALVRDWLLEHLPLFHHAKFDARGNGEAHAEAALQKLGPARVECVKATPAWYASAWPKYRAALEDRSIELPRSEPIIADHRRVVLRNGYPTVDDGEDRDTDGLMRHGDAAVAALLAWMATYQEGEPPAGAQVAPPAQPPVPEAARGRRPVTMWGRDPRAPAMA